MQRWEGRLRGGKRIVVWEHPKNHPGFTGYGKGRHNKQVGIKHEGEFVWLKCTFRATQDDNIACTPSCKKAEQRICSCSCGGKNHGIENQDGPHSIDLDDVVWRG